MITLYAFGEGFGLPEISPYVTKTEVQLRMAGLDYVKAPGQRELSPKGQLPWIEDDGELIADSHFIRLHLERKYGVDFDEGLCPVQRAQAWTIERMMENHFVWTIHLTRWLTPENFAKGPAMFFGALPPEVRQEVIDGAQAAIAQNVTAGGLGGRHSDAEVLGLTVRSLSALSAMLGDQPFMMGERPSGVDAAVFGVLSGLMTPYFDGPIRESAVRFENLAAYVDRMMAGVYPGFAWASLSRAPEPVAA